MVNVQRHRVVTNLSRLEGPKLAIPIEAQPNREDPNTKYKYEQAEFGIGGLFKLFVLTSN